MASLSAVEMTLSDGTPVSGWSAPGFDEVVDAFAVNFQDDEELGASLCLTQDGETVLDIWGGYTTKARQTPWQEDSLSVVFSATKGATALCAHVLSAQGKLDLDAPIASYWPEFGCNGKETATVTMILDHSLGVPVIQEKLKEGGYYDWDYMTNLIARQTPLWDPGTRLSYHATTFGWILGELVRRVTGKSLGTFFQDEVAGPLGLDFWIGFPEEYEPRLVQVIPNRPNVKHGPVSLFLETALNDGESIPHKFSFNNGGASARDRAYRAAEIGAAGGVTNARGLAGMYAPLACGGALNGVRLVDKDTLHRMGRVAMATHLDATLMIPTRFALGFTKSMDNRNVTRVPDTDSLIMSDSAFGHAGMGGYLGFADPEERLSFGYAMNFMGHGNLINRRGQNLVDAAYLSLGYTRNGSGVWVK